MVSIEEARSSLHLYSIDYCMFVCKISLVNCSNGARRVSTKFASDIVFESAHDSAAISLQHISRNSSSLETRTETYFKVV